MFINDKTEYLFSEHYKEQLIAFLRYSFAFNISVPNKSQSVKTETTEEERLTVRKVNVTILESRLPRHCNPELVEQALAHLEATLEKGSVKNSVLLSPENEDYKLLEILGKYTRNDRFDSIGYKIGMGAMFAMIPMIVICSVLMTIVLSFPSSLLGLIVYFSTFFAMFASIVLGIMIMGTEGDLGLKFGRWIGDLIKSKNREPSNLQDLDEKLNRLINGQAKAPQHEERVEPVTYTKNPSSCFD